MSELAEVTDLSVRPPPQGHLSNGSQYSDARADAGFSGAVHWCMLVANVVTRQLLDVVQDLKERAPGEEFPCLLNKAGTGADERWTRRLHCFVHPDVNKWSIAGADGKVAITDTSFTWARGDIR